MSSLPAGWVRACLGEIVFLKTGPFGSALHQADYVLDGVPLVNPMHISGGKIFPSDGMRVSAETLEKLSDFRLKKGDVVLGRRGEMGRCAVVTEREVGWLCGTGSLIVRPNSSVMLPEYLQKLLESDAVVQYLLSASVGSTMANLNQEHLLRLEVDVPPVLEQARVIAKFEELLSDIEAGVAELKSAQKKLALYRQSLLKAAVEGTLTAAWRQRNTVQESGEELLRRILGARRTRWEAEQIAKYGGQGKTPPKNWKNKYVEAVEPDVANLPSLPQGWVWASLDALIAEGPQNGLYLPAERYGKGVPILRINDYQIGWCRERDKLNQVDADADQLSVYSLSVDDVVVNRVNSMTHLGKSLVVPVSLGGAVFESNMMRVRLAEGANARYVCAYLGSSIGRRRLIKNAKWAVNQASINQQDVRATPIPLPPLEEQEALMDLLMAQIDGVQSQEDAILNSLKQAAAQRQNILRAAFSGQLVPQDPADEPAGVLLERIQAERAAGARKPVRGRRGSRAAEVPQEAG